MLVAFFPLTAQQNSPPSPAAEPAAPVADTVAPPPVDAPAPPPCKGKKCPKTPKKKKPKKEKPPKVTPATITRGTLTVDGIVGKAALNYSIPDLKFIYIYAPGIGVVVVSDNKFAGGAEQKNAFDGHTLTVKASDHEMQIYSDDILLGKKAVIGKGGKDKKAEPAWVALDANFTMPSRFPVVGYGDKPVAPYAWPGSKMNVAVKGIEEDAPPVPKHLAPVLAENPCPKGLVLVNAPPVEKDASDTVAARKPGPKCMAAKDVPAAAPAPYVPLEKRARD